MGRADPDLELFDAACEALIAAQALHRTAARAGAAPAIAPTIGCLRSVLGELAGTVETLADQRRPHGAPDVHALRRALGEAAAALRLADDAAERARTAAAAAGVHAGRGQDG